MKRLVVLGIIPARGGSKGIPNKNITRLGKQPLLAYTIRAARASRHLSDFLLSTDSPAIQRVARQWDCPAPFRRPARLATDRAKSMDVIRHAVTWYETEKGQRIDAVMILQPTSPFRTAGDIDRSIALLTTHPAADSVVSFQPLTHAHPDYLYVPGHPWALPYTRSTTQPRQAMKSFWVRNGAIYLLRRHVLFQKNDPLGHCILPYVMPPERSVNIDEPFDLKMAEGFLRLHGLPT